MYENKKTGLLDVEEIASNGQSTILAGEE